MLRKYKRTAGVTLAETVVVLAVLVVVSANISFVPAERRLLAAAAIEVRSDIRYLQRIALTEGRRTRITFNSDDNSYILDKWEEGRYKKIKTVKFDPVVESLFTNASGANITFTARGTTGDACVIYIYSDKYTAELTVNVGAGRVKIKEIYKKTGR